MTPTGAALLIACLALAGCAGPGASLPGASARSPSFNFTLDLVPAGADWVAVQLDVGDNQVVVATSVVDIAFPPGADPAASRACYLMSLDGTGPLDPVVAAEDIDPTPAGFCSNLFGKNATTQINQIVYIICKPQPDQVLMSTRNAYDIGLANPLRNSRRSITDGSSRARNQNRLLGLQ